jgi:hypothetical protein
MVEYLGRFLVYFREFGRALGQEICCKVEEAASGVSVDTGNRYFLQHPHYLPEKCITNDVDPDPDLYVFGPPGSASGQVRTTIRLQILPSSSKNCKKNLDFYCFVTSL